MAPVFDPADASGHRRRPKRGSDAAGTNASRPASKATESESHGCNLRFPACFAEASTVSSIP